MIGARDEGSRRRVRRLCLAACALSVCLAVGAQGASEAPAPEIRIQNFQFVPPTLEAPAGTTVTWVNQDEEIHSVTSPDGQFTSPGLDSAQRFSYRFEKPGTYAYHCALHPQMSGTIIVR